MPTERDDLDAALDFLLGLIEPLAIAAIRRAVDTVAAQVGTTAAGDDWRVSVSDLGRLRAEWTASVDGELLPMLAEVYDAGTLSAHIAAGDAAVAAASARGGTSLRAIMDTRQADFLAGARNRMTGVGDDLWAVARETLVTGFKRGDSLEDMRAALRDVAGFGETRAITVARTEVISAANAGSLDGQLALGEFGAQTKTWLATMDARTRETHAAADGQTVPVNEAFDVGGESLMFPGDPAGSAGEVVNCRCTLIYDAEDADTEGRQTGGVTEEVADELAASAEAPMHDLVAKWTPIVASASNLTAEDGARLLPLTVEQAQAYEARWQALVAAAPRPDEWEGVAIVLGIATGDRRRFENLAWADPPAPLMVQRQNPEFGGHNLAEIGGVITAFEKRDNLVVIRGWHDHDSAAGSEGARLMREGIMRGISVDPDQISEQDVELIWPADPSVCPDGMCFEPELVVFHNGRIRGATQTPFPAFVEAFIAPLGDAVIDGPDVEPLPEGQDLEGLIEAEEETAPDPDVEEDEAMAAAAYDGDGGMVALVPTDADAQRLAIEGGEDAAELHVTLVFLGDDTTQLSDDEKAVIVDAAGAVASSMRPFDANAFGAAVFNPAGDKPCVVLNVGGQELADAHAALGDVVADVTQHAPWVAHLTLAYAADPMSVLPAALERMGPITFDRVRVAFAGETIDLPLGGDAVDEDEAVAAAAIVAAAHTITIPDVPPASWFLEPPRDVVELGALTITDDGRVMGLLAPGKTAHIGYRDRHITVPTRHVDYSRFMRGECHVEGGGRVAVGNITMGCGHAGLHLDGTPSADHYDNTCSLFSRIAVGETRDGTGNVWVAGALYPGVSPDQVVRAMGCALSGDWRPRRDGKAGRELVAALLVPVPGFPKARTAPSVRVRHDEHGQLVASAVPVRFIAAAAPLDGNEAWRAARAAIARSIGRDPESRRRELVAAVHGGER